MGRGSIPRLGAKMTTKRATVLINVRGYCKAENTNCKGYNLYPNSCTNCSEFVGGAVDKKEIEDALNEIFDHKMVYKGYIQIFPNAIYSIDGKKVQELYERLGLENKVSS